MDTAGNEWQRRVMEIEKGSEAGWRTLDGAVARSGLLASKAAYGGVSRDPILQDRPSRNLFLLTTQRAFKRDSHSLQLTYRSATPVNPLDSRGPPVLIWFWRAKTRADLRSAALQRTTRS